MQTYKLLKTLKVGTSEASYSLCVSLNLSLGFAVGLLNKTVKFYQIEQNQSNNPSNWSFEMIQQTSIDTHRPRIIKYFNSLAFVCYDDQTKVIKFGEGKKPQVLEIIYKPFGKVMDFKIS